MFNKVSLLKIALFFTVFIPVLSFGQNARIGATSATPNASAMLEVDGVTGIASGNYKGILIPRMTFAERTSIVTLAAIAQGLLVYQTNVSGASLEGFYYNTSITTTPNWVYLGSGSSSGWEITGNNNTTAANFIGTTVAQPFIVKTGGNAAGNERMRVLPAGQVVVNNTGIGAYPDVFSVYANGTTNGTTTNISNLGTVAISGYSSGDGNGVYGENNATGIGVVGANTNTSALAVNTSAAGVFGYNDRTPSGTGVSYGVVGAVASNVTSGTVRGVEGSNYSTTGIGVIGFALAPTGSAIGVQGESYGEAGNGVTGFSATTATSATPCGVYGQAISSTGVGVMGYNVHASGTGVVGVGNNVGSFIIPAGSGGSFLGERIGTFTVANSVASSTGIFAGSNNPGLFVLAAGTGVVGESDRFGIAGLSDVWNLGAISGAGYFDMAGAYAAYVMAITAGGTIRKIEGNGTVNTVVKDINGQRVVLSAPEAPENLFMDFGRAKLEAGQAHITLDPNFSINIVVNNEHPLRVILTPEGESNNLYFTNANNNGFDVKESNSGISDIYFTWMVIANRADEPGLNGTISRYSSERFAPAMPIQEKNKIETRTISTKNFEMSTPAAPPKSKHP